MSGLSIGEVKIMGGVAIVIENFQQYNLKREQQQKGKMRSLTRADSGEKKEVQG